MSRPSRTLSIVLGSLALVLAGLVLPAPAVAATTPTITEVGDGYHFIGGAENNDVIVTIVGGRVLVHDQGATSFGFVGANCVSVPVDTGAAVSCKRKSPTIFHADLGDGDDRVDGSTLPQLVRLDVRTGDGVNFVTGSAGNDILRGQSSPGNADTLNGGAGNDRITAGDGDGFLNGGDGNDVFVGGPGEDVIQGGAGGDYVRSLGGSDIVFGNAGNDGLSGDGADDFIDGGPGNDSIQGGEGNDTLIGDVGRDTFAGNTGDDSIDSVDDARDGVDCGDGVDSLVADAPAVFLGFPVGGDAISVNTCESVSMV